MPRLLKRLAALLIGAFAISLALPAAAAGPNWLTTVALTPQGSHVLGNPAAPIKVTAWISYTCPHCAEFERVSDGPMRIGYIAPGKASIEIKHLLRDPIDATVAQLANCGPKERFFANHGLFMRRQAEWIAPLASASAAQRQRWSSGDHAAQRRAIASDFHLYEILEGRGYRRVELDRCLADEALANRIAGQTVEAIKLGFEGTPGFALNGLPLAGTYTWASLEMQIKARL